MKKLTFLAMIAAAFVFASCGTTKVEDTTAEAPVFEGAWVVEEFVNNGEVLTGATANIEIAAPVDGIYKVLGNTGINTFLPADFTIVDGKFAPVNAEALAQTLKAGSPDAMAYENAFKALLLSTSNIALEGDKLVISNDTAKATFVVGAPSATPIEDEVPVIEE